jgi:hypothetical protein
MKTPVLSRTVGAKVTEAEFAEIQSRAFAQGQTVSAWVRDLLLGATAATEKGGLGGITLGELLALRSIVITLLFEIGTHKQLTAEAVEEIIQHAEREKVRRVAKLLTNSET